MADLSTTFMGIPLRNPIIAGASGLTANLKSIRNLEEAGAGALVLKSLFEEQIQLERFKFDEDLHKNDGRHAEMITTQPDLEYAGPAEHLMWVKQAKQAASIPVLASLNAVNRDTWVEYAKRLEDTGVDGLELNFFASPKSPSKEGTAIEDEQVELVQALRQTVGIPISLKLSTFYSNLLNVVHRMDEAGPAAFVLFNRLFEPDIDVHAEQCTSPFNLSHDTDYRLPLRYAGLLEGTVKADLCCSTGIFTGEQAVKVILAGATTVQTVSALFRHGAGHIQTMLRDMQAWMDQKGYRTLGEFRGKLSQRHIHDPWAYTRAQYARLLLNPEAMMQSSPAI